MDGSMRIGDVARACGVSTDTIRWYEKQGVLAPVHRERNGYRVYDAQTIERVRVVRRAITVGFSVAELAASSASAPRDGRRAARCGRWRRGSSTSSMRASAS